MNFLNGVKSLFGAQPQAAPGPSKTVSYSVANLDKSSEGSDLIQAHNSVLEWYDDRMAKREKYYNALHPDTRWDADDREAAKQKKKALVSLGKMKPAERTFIGSLIQQRYDVTPAPREPQDQDISDVLSQLYHWTADTTQIRMHDPNLIREAWAGGNAWQESWVEIVPGKKPTIRLQNQNNFAIYPDPNRRDLVTNRDCRFIDRESWLSLGDLCDKFPEHEEALTSALYERKATYYEPGKVFVDRQHEWMNERNGMFRVIERFYKVKRKLWYGVSGGDRIDIGYDVPKEGREAFKAENPDHGLHTQSEEFLYLAIVCPAFGVEYLYNGPYHCQPRDPVTGEIMFPLYELIDEELAGDPSGHVEHLIDPMKIIDSMMVNKLAAAKNAAGQSHVVDRGHFEEDVLTDITETLSDGSRTYVKKENKQGTGIELIQQGSSSRDGDGAISIASNAFDEASSTPPSLQGFSEGSGTPASLNEQRIQQASVQSQVQVTNYIRFLTTRAKLWQYYWGEYFDFEMVIRVVHSDKESPEFMTINKIIMDNFGGVKKENNLANASAYDIAFEDSWKSPTQRDKIMKGLERLMNTGAVQGDPVLNTFLTFYYLTLTDAPSDLKALFKERSEVMKQAAAQQEQMSMQTQEIDQIAKLQGIAEAEAQQTAPRTNMAPRRPEPAMAGEPA